MKITMQEKQGVWSVAMENGESVYPTTTYDSAMAACARVLQLLDLDMVAAQPHPERVLIGRTE